jgi:hypothetical protein
MRKIFTIIQLMTLVWPSVWDWKEMDLVSLLSISDQRLDHNVLRKYLSQSKMMVCGIQKCVNTHSKKSLAVFFQESIITIL